MCIELTQYPCDDVTESRARYYCYGFHGDDGLGQFPWKPNENLNY